MPLGMQNIARYIDGINVQKIDGNKDVSISFAYAERSKELYRSFNEGSGNIVYYFVVI